MHSALRLVIIGSILGSGATPGFGYLTWLPSYNEMAAKADVVVIATPVERREVRGTAALPGVARGGNPIPALAIETTFQAVVIFRGQLAENRRDFTLLHYREAEPPPPVRRTGGPMLIDFTPGDASQYLMFLRRREDGRYEAVNPAEPAWCIEKLGHRWSHPGSPR